MNKKKILFVLSSALLLILIIMAASVYSFFYLDRYPNATVQEECPLGLFNVKTIGDIQRFLNSETWLIAVSKGTCLTTTDSYDEVHAWHLERGWRALMDFSNANENEIKFRHICIDYNKTFTVNPDDSEEIDQFRWFEMNDC